jgi:ribosomal subunit interface protein
MEVVVKGRNVDVPEHFRVHVDERLARLQRYDRKGLSFDVELLHEPNRRQQKSCQRVEITGKGTGPVVRAEACAGDFYAALDAAVHKVESRLRREHDRRKVHHGRHRPAPASVAAPRPVTEPAEGDGHGSAALVGAGAAVHEAAEPEMQSWGNAGDLAGRSTGTATEGLDASAPPGGRDTDARRAELDSPAHEPGRVVREKEHAARPMSVDDALCEMELVGHDFYLFSDIDTRKPSVVYRRKGFDYAVIRLAT